MTGAKRIRVFQRLLSGGTQGAVADVRPLHGVRFDTRRTGPIGSLIAPPYDVAAEPAQGTEFSIRKIEGVDLGCGGHDHAVAAARYQAWLEQGVLRRDAVPAIYVHEHEFSRGGKVISRTGLLFFLRIRQPPRSTLLPCST